MQASAEAPNPDFKPSLTFGTYTKQLSGRLQSQEEEESDCCTRL